MTEKNYFQNIIIPSNGQEIALKMKEAKKTNNTDFYQSLWWYDIFHYEDQKSLNNFISMYSQNDSQKYSSISNLTENDLEYLAIIMKKRSIEEYEYFFGV
tara:strand:+ start:88 stop:387 length:300 start_codon:yes stop_codon:yes gene_type:complete